MELNDLEVILKRTNFPVRYSHFKKKVETPYIVYINAYNSNFGADDKVYRKIKNIQIELYTNEKNLEIEKILEDLLDENDIFYEESEEFIESENLFQKIYEVRLI